MHIKQVYVYPIKSFRGHSLPSLPATYQGFAYDRSFMLLDASKMKHMNVSNYPEMCLFATELIFPGDSSDDTKDSTGKIIVTFNPPSPNPFSPAHIAPSTLSIPLQPSTMELEEIEVDMYTSATVGYNMGSTFNSWISERLGYQIILVYLGQNRRKVLGNLPPRVAGEQQRKISAINSTQSKSWFSSLTASLPSIPFFSNQTTDAQTYPGVDEGITFADCAPYLVISTKSWENAQSRLSGSGSYADELDITKFRPNIVVEGADEPYEEDYWAEIDIFPLGSPASRAKLVLTANCARCNSLNVDYATGKVGTGEAGKILKKLQSDRRVDPGTKYSPVFGRYGFLDRVGETSEGGERDSSRTVISRTFRGGLFMVNVGDEVKVTRRNGERTVFDWPGLST